MTDPSQSTQVLSVMGVGKSFRMGASLVPALVDVSLSIGAGERVCLMGRSGSGKTTLLNILGLIEDADVGEVRFQGQDVRALGEGARAAFRARQLGFVFQTFNLIPVLTARENVEYPMLLTGVPKRERSARIDELLESVGIAKFASHRPDELSGGQRQRVAIARALANRPAIVLADELTSALDLTTSVEIMELIVELNRVSRTTFVFSSHDPVVADHSTRVVDLSDGRILSETNR
jgi:putative ABC transport system ATP-binding protein